MKLFSKINGVLLISAISGWIILSAVDYLFFYKLPLVDILLYRIPPHAFFSRLTIILLTITAARGFAAQISKKKDIEIALFESEKEFENLFNNARVGLFRSKISDGKLLECNNLLAQMFGYSDRDEFIDSFSCSVTINCNA